MSKKGNQLFSESLHTSVSLVCYLAWHVLINFGQHIFARLISFSLREQLAQFTDELAQFADAMELDSSLLERYLKSYHKLCSFNQEPESQ